MSEKPQENAATAASDGMLIIEDDVAAPEPAGDEPEHRPWRILIVDDDVDVHVVTKFALSNTEFHGRRLSFLHAYSGREAMQMLKEQPDIALVLLDVIMETEDAGLKVARDIRSELHNELVRIILRTGQPGQSLEHSVIVNYDINDYWSKTDLTTRKLFTTVIAALRSYATLSGAAAERAVLRARLAKANQVQSVVDQHALVLTLNRAGRIRDANDMVCKLAGSSRAALAGSDLHVLHPGPYPEALASAIMTALRRDGGWAGDIHTRSPDGKLLDLRCAVLAFRDGNGVPYQYVAVATVLASVQNDS